MIINLHSLYSVGGMIIGVILLLLVIYLVIFVATKGDKNGN